MQMVDQCCVVKKGLDRVDQTLIASEHVRVWIQLAFAASMQQPGDFVWRSQSVC